MICHTSHKNINYAILHYSNLQLTAYNAYIHKHAENHKSYSQIHTRSHFLDSCRQEVLLRQAAISQRQPQASETRTSKLNSTETNPVIFHIPESILNRSRNLIQTCKLIFKRKISKNWGTGSPISLCNS